MSLPRLCRSGWLVRGTRLVTGRLALILLVTIAGSSTWPTFVAEAQQTGDVVYLRDGSVLGETITLQVPGESILIRTRDGNVPRITIDRVARFAEGPMAPTAMPQMAQEKSPGLAFLLSFLVPGLGQFYNGQYGKGAGMLAGSVVGGVLVSQTWVDCWEDDVDCGEWTAGAVLLVGSWVWSMIDAPVSARAINRRAGAGGMALDIGPRFEVVPSQRTFRPVLRAGELSIAPDRHANISVARLQF